VRAADGYEVIFALPEIDPEFTAQTILLAYEVDGKPLPKGEGPFRLVVPNDKKHARWIREITTITVTFSKQP
jgi:DMSO/TMAO reductase YedYZ molybdopterin-dependent catalytic subunit